MPSLFGGRKKAYVFNGTAAPNTRSCWSQDHEAESGSQTALARASPRLSLAFGFGEEPPQPPSLPRVPKPPKMPPPSLPNPCEVDNSSKIQKPEQRPETIPKPKRPSSASRASAAVSAAWSAARAALNSTAASPPTSQHKDSKGQKTIQGHVNENGQTDGKNMVADDAQHAGYRNESVKSQKQQVIALAREEDVADTQLELQILTKQLVAAVYDRSLSEDEVAAVLKTCPEVSWLAQCAQNAPSPVGWQRCGCLPGSDGDLVVCYANTSTDEVIETTPLLESFAELAKLAVHAVVNSKGAGNAARWVFAARDAALKKAAKAQESWSGPHVDEQSGEEFYYCTSTGCSSWTSPAAAHAYVAHVAQQLLQSHIFPEHIDDSAPNDRKHARDTERKLGRDTMDRKPKGDYPNKVGANGYVAEAGARQADDISPQKEKRRHDRSRKLRSSPAKSHESGSRGNDDIRNTTYHLPSGYEREHADIEVRRRHRRSCESRLRVPRPSVRSDVSESLDSDRASSSASCVPIGSGRNRHKKAPSNPMFFEIHSDDSDDNDSMSCESVKPERAPRRQKQKRRVSSGTNDSRNHNITDESTNNKAAAALAGAAAALSAAAVALAGLDKNGSAQEMVQVDSLLAAASALRGAGSDPPTIPSTAVETSSKRLSKTSECKMQSGIPRLALDRLHHVELEPDYPKGDAATGRYTLAYEANTLDLDDSIDKEEPEEADFLPLSNQTRYDEEPKPRPSKLSPLPPEVRNAADTRLQGALIDAKTLLEYAEEAAAGDTPTSSATSQTVLNAERQEAIAVAESALRAACDHVSISSRQPKIEETQCPQPVTQEGAKICNQELKKACDDEESRVPRKRVSVGGA